MFQIKRNNGVTKCKNFNAARNLATKHNIKEKQKRCGWKTCLYTRRLDWAFGRV